MGRSLKEISERFEQNIMSAYMRGAKNKNWAEGMLEWNRGYPVEILEQDGEEPKIVNVPY